MKKAIVLFVLVIISTGCWPFTSKPKIQVKNEMVYHSGLDYDVKVTQLKLLLKHKFIIQLKSIDNIDLNQVDYDIKIPNYDKDFNGTFELEDNIILNPNWDYKEFEFRTEEFGLGSFCEQMNAMFDSEDDVFSMSMNLTFHTTEGKTYEVNDIVVKVKDHDLWDKIRNFVVKYGCDPSKIITKIKELF
jgi:hypothetical protein